MGSGILNLKLFIIVQINLLQIRELTRENKPDVLAISESWLNSSTSNAEVEREGFEIIPIRSPS